MYVSKTDAVPTVRDRNGKKSVTMWRKEAVAWDILSLF
jgi:hypothetical protein